MSKNSEIEEWAVISVGFRGFVTVHKGELGSRDEAEAWLKALTITQARQDEEHFMRTDGVIVREQLQVAKRQILPWKTV